MAADQLLVQASIVLIFGGLTMVFLFALLAYRNMKGVSKDALAARANVHFDRVAQGIALFTIGFFAVLLGHLPTLLGLPFAAEALVVGSALWVVMMASSLRTLYWSVRIPRSLRRGFFAWRPTRSSSAGRAPGIRGSRGGAP